MSPNVRYNVKNHNNYAIPTPTSNNRQKYKQNSNKNYAVSPSIYSNISSYKEKTQNTQVSPNFSHNQNSFDVHPRDYSHNVKEVSNFCNKFEKNPEKLNFSKDYEAYSQNLGAPGHYPNRNLNDTETEYSVDMIEKGFQNFYKENKTNSSFINVEPNNSKFTSHTIKNFEDTGDIIIGENFLYSEEDQFYNN